MARGKTSQVVYKRVMIKGKPKFVKVSKTVVKGTNLSKGMGGGTQPWTTDKAALASEKISQEASVKKAQIAGRTANVAQVTTAATSIANNAINSNRQNVNAAVDQSVLGGLVKGGNTRDEDSEDNPYID